MKKIMLIIAAVLAAVTFMTAIGANTSGAAGYIPPGCSVESIRDGNGWRVRASCAPTSTTAGHHFRARGIDICSGVTYTGSWTPITGIISVSLSNRTLLCGFGANLYVDYSS